ncbi:MFS transporter [Pseudomonadales bacterium]|jgi:predicted MFS family arabinose efflux permease|nr:MFS transporter [Gammaproteobacteria bacterium]MDA7753572.1 MFS transporter [Pseudomonadales bacterium]MBT3733008.1 MFS transporter [Gammaproteobacteria bacterium]MBT3898546.1 MFS transporter [Gammaproteobacteria bacterium]MDA8880467.1 MFS transporter [Pseudomonadales bacterium]
MKAAGRKPSGFDVLSIPQFRWLFVGNVAFFFAMQGQMLTRTILAWDLTGLAQSLAYINLVVALPMIFASMIGGAVTDRVERRQLIIVGQCLITCNEIFILTMLLLGQLEFWHLLCTAFVAGCAFPFIMPARMAITVNVVGPDRIQSAMAVSGGAMNLSRVVGPAMMGVIISEFSVIAAYVVSTILYASAVFCMFFVKRNKAVQPDGGKKPLLADIIYGFQYVSLNKPVLVCLMFGLVPMFLAMPFQNLLVMLVEQTWQVGESGLGILMGAGGVGGVLGSIWIARRGDRSERLRLMVVTVIGFALFLAVFTQTSVFYLALLPLVLANLCASAFQTVNNATIQILVDDSVRGRMSSFMMMSFGLTPLGVFPMAVAADHIGAANAILGACVALMIITVAFVGLSRTLRAIDSTVRVSMDREHKEPLAG